MYSHRNAWANLYLLRQPDTFFGPDTVCFWGPQSRGGARTPRLGVPIGLVYSTIATRSSIELLPGRACRGPKNPTLHRVFFLTFLY